MITNSVRHGIDILNNFNNSNWELGDILIFQEELKKVMRLLKNGKSLRVDNILLEFLKHGGPKLIKVLTTYQKIWEKMQWPKE